MEPFGRYTLSKRLGAGGMGEVFLATATGETAQVVIKRILPHLAANPRFLRLFLDETRIASRLIHPNIARITELGEVNGSWFVAMEHVDGKDLREVLKRSRELNHHVPIEVAVAIAVEVARALEYAHDALDASGRPLKIVHRDVSPHNVLLGRDGVVKLIDFGVAKAANKSVHTASGILKGKFPYMAPEQAFAKSVDARTDVFALAIVLWEMVCARFLFRGKSDAATLRLVREAVVPPPSTLRDDVPPALDSILLKALRKEPKDRFQSMRPMREALEEVLSGLPAPSLARWLREYDDVVGLEVLGDEADSIVSEPAFNQDAPTFVPPPSAGRPPRTERPESESEALEHARRLLQVAARATNIGAQTSSFVGRVAELADLHQLFRAGVRLITLLGPGGTGKTRLSLQFGTQLISYFQGLGERGRRRGGVWFCDLTEAHDLDGICAAVARALGVPLVPGDTVKQLGHAVLARGEVLLVLDNFEQVAALGADTVAKWMTAAPDARFVVSSRELLRIPDETVYEVPALRTPLSSEGDARTSESVELFVERARAARPGWDPTPGDLDTIAQVVRQLDGMPLAIELAAARMSVLTPTQLLARLPRRFDLLVDRRFATERQATLRGAIDWSWRMLSPIEASTLTQLSVFRGGFSAAAAKAVVTLPAAEAQADPLEVVMNLRAKSLVRAYFPLGDEAHTRFGLYESIREYAREKFESPQAQLDAFERHTTYFLALGQKLAATAESSKAQLDLLDLERDNLTSVFQRALATVELGPRALQATLALDPLLALRGPYQVHLQMIDGAMQKLGDDKRLRAAGLETRVRARQARGRTAEAEQDCLEVLGLATQLNDQGLEGRAEFYLGLIDRVKGHRGDARRRLTRALTLLESVGDRRMRGRALSNMAVLQLEMGLETDALEGSNEALEIHRQVHDRLYEGVTLANLGVMQQALGLLKPARANYQAALGIHRELGNRRSEGISHINLGDLAADFEQPGQSRAHYESALAILRDVGARRFEGVALTSLASLHLQYGELDDAATRYHEGIALLQEVRDQRYEGLAQAGLAAVEALKGDLTAAEERIAEATRLLTESGDASFLDTLDIYRAHLELGHVLKTQSEHQAHVLEERIRKRIAHAEHPGAVDTAHPAGMPSPAARSEHVRAALRSLKGALVDCGKDQ